MPPDVQVLPRQEPYPAASGARHACALPYAMEVQARVSGNKQLVLAFANTGSAGAAFIVYSRERTGGPWYYTVEAGQADRSGRLELANGPL